MSAKKPVVSTYLQYTVIAAVFRYLRGTLLFERWYGAPVFALDDGETSPPRTPDKDVPADGGKPSPGTGGKEL